MGDTQHRWQQIEAPLRARVWLPSKVAFTGRVNARSPTATASGWKALPSVDHHRPASASDQAKLTLKVVKLFNQGATGWARTTAPFGPPPRTRWWPPAVCFQPDQLPEMRMRTSNVALTHRC